MLNQEAATNDRAVSRVVVSYCPVCGECKRRKWLDAFDFELYTCTGCGHHYASSRFVGHRLSHGYYQEPDADLIARSIAAKRQRFEEYRRAFPSIFLTSGSVLDVGCNAGELLALFQERGWSVAGVEQSPGPAAFARRRLNAPVWSGPIEDYAPDGIPFDLVTMIHVLEHLVDPRSVLRRLATLAEALLIEVPNVDDPLLSIFGGFYRPLCPGDHISFFTHASLSRLLEGAGWHVSAILTPLHARDLVYGSILSALDLVRTLCGRRLPGAGGVDSQLRYRGRLRRPLKELMDCIVESIDPAVVSAQRLLAANRGTVLIVYATRCAPQIVEAHDIQSVR
jgi:SAM-dependent methyltransferase